MTSPTGKKQPPSKSPMETAAVLEQAVATLHYRNLQLERTLWLSAAKAGGEMIVDETTIDILWKLGFQRTPEGHLKVMALKIPEAQEDDIAKCAKDLLGTNGLLHVYVEAHKRLSEYPLQYVELRLSKYIRFIGDRWETAAPQN